MNLNINYNDIVFSVFLKKIMLKKNIKVVATTFRNHFKEVILMSVKIIDYSKLSQKHTQ